MQLLDRSGLETETESNLKTIYIPVGAIRMFSPASMCSEMSFERYEPEPFATVEINARKRR